ncbi:hypothetical protein CSA56_02645 [candidate division KSB3 bacterium]|uniref:ClbS/DfsB family four-helix bundle protein n=1 Tax=candidate division KSB3 bacterium TaxID=2044937 RepID=A0A2G6KJE2_9BACT|nr:MAG: hypothetical protein CSA56_02645 [candidate division KSB3 bacterium]
MPRPRTKKDLIEASHANFAKLWEIIDGLSEKEFNTAFDFSDNSKLTEAHWNRDKNIRDILVHLYEWHQLLINWISNNQKGIETSLLPAPYTWKTYSEMNVGFWKAHQKTPYEKSIKMLNNSHKEVMSLIESFSDEELFSKKYFSCVGAYCVSSTSSHYDWAIKKIKTHKKNMKTSKKMV